MAAPHLIRFTPEPHSPPMPAMPPPSPDYTAQLIRLLKDFTQDWDQQFDGEMDRNTRLFANLGFESIDIIQLVVAIQEEVAHAAVPFEKLLMREGRYVDDLAIGQIADFLAQQQAAS